MVMRKKQMFGLSFLCVGIALIILAIHAMIKIANAKGFVNDMSNFFTNNPTWNPIITFFGGEAQKEISAYDLPSLLCLIAGILLTIAGSLIILSRNQKK